MRRILYGSRMAHRRASELSPAQAPRRVGDGGRREEMRFPGMIVGSERDGEACNLLHGFQARPHQPVGRDRRPILGGVKPRELAVEARQTVVDHPRHPDAAGDAQGFDPRCRHS